MIVCDFRYHPVSVVVVNICQIHLKRCMDFPKVLLGCLPTKLLNQGFTTIFHSINENCV